MRDDAKRLRSGVVIASGTVGRMNIMIRQGALNPSGIAMLVLSEVDETLVQGFNDHVLELFSKLPSNVQTVLSATDATGPDMRELSALMTKTPVRVCVGPDTISREVTAGDVTSVGSPTATAT